MATAKDVIESALRELGVLAAGEASTADDAADGLVALNRWVDTAAAERPKIYTTTRTTWTIVASTGQYDVGTGGDVNITRPVFVDHVNFQDTSVSPTAEYPLMKLTEDGWASVGHKTQEATLPGFWYYNPTFASGLATLDLWPVPTSATLQGVLYAPAAVAQFAALATTVSLPPGYEEMFVTNLAVRLAPSHGRPVDPELKERARESKAVVMRANKRLTDLSLDPAALIGSGRGGGYDIRRG